MLNDLPSLASILVSIYCNKGGVGKTTLLHNLAYILSTYFGLRVLVVDADPQCNISNQLLKTPHQDDLAFMQRELNNVKDLEKLVAYYYSGDYRRHLAADPEGYDQFDINDCFKPLMNVRHHEGGNFLERAKKVKIRRTCYPNLFLLPGHMDFEDASTVTSSAYNNQRTTNRGETEQFVYLTKYIREIARLNKIDLVLTDLNPSMSILNANLILGGDYFFIPAYPDCYTNQVLGALPTKIQAWVNGMHFYRQRVHDALKLQKPAKFLGYVALRYPSHTQKDDDRPDVVAAYNEWWEKIHEAFDKSFIPILRSMTVDDEPYPMVTENFRFSRVGIKEFHSLGERLQECGVPISDVRAVIRFVTTWPKGKSRLSDNQASAEHYFHRFKHLACLVLSNMSSETLARWNMPDVASFKFSGNVFGGILRKGDAVPMRGKDNEGVLEFDFYPSSKIDPEADVLLGLPIPCEYRQVYKRLHSTSNRLPMVKALLEDEVIQMVLKVFAQFPNNERWIQTILPICMHQLQERKPEVHQAITRYIASNRGRRPDKAEQDRCISVIRKHVSQFLFLQFFPDPRKKNDYVPRFSFNDSNAMSGQSARVFLDANTFNFVKAVLMSLEGSEKFKLYVWQKNPDSPEDDLKLLFKYEEPELHDSLHVFYDAEAHAFRLLVPKHPLALELDASPAPENAAALTSSGYAYRDEDINKILLSYFPDNDGNSGAVVLAAQHPFLELKVDGQPNRTFVFDLQEAIRSAIRHNKPSLLPINLDDSVVQSVSEVAGTHWVSVIIVPNLQDRSKPTIYYIDPMGSGSKEDVEDILKKTQADFSALGSLWARGGHIRKFATLVKDAAENLEPVVNVLSVEQQVGDRAAEGCGPWMVTNFVDWILQKRLRKIQDVRSSDFLRLEHAAKLGLTSAPATRRRALDFSDESSSRRLRTTTLFRDSQGATALQENPAQHSYQRSVGPS